MFPETTIICKHFNNLTPHELHQVYQLRASVFMIDQRCLVNEVDDTDLNSYHMLLVNSEGKLLSYLRFFEPMGTPNTVQIGRVVTLPNAQGQGHGTKLMQAALEKIDELHSTSRIKLHAQVDKVGFYEKFGFTADKDSHGKLHTFLSDNVSLVAMYYKD